MVRIILTPTTTLSTSGHILLWRGRICVQMIESVHKSRVTALDYNQITQTLVSAAQDGSMCVISYAVEKAKQGGWCNCYDCLNSRFVSLVLLLGYYRFLQLLAAQSCTAAKEAGSVCKFRPAASRPNLSSDLRYRTSRRGCQARCSFPGRYPPLCNAIPN